MIIGLGTGRCGTVSLSKLLQRAGLNVTHELKPVMSWCSDDIVHRVNTLNKARVDGDIAFWYLNYIEELNEKYGSDNIRFICMQRDPDEVVESFLKKTTGRNHWMKHNNTKWKLDPCWDKCFPKYEVKDKAAAIRLYCKGYHEKSKYYSRNLRNFKVCNINELNTKDEVASIFNFLKLNINITDDLINIKANRT